VGEVYFWACALGSILLAAYCPRWGMVAVLVLLVRTLMDEAARELMTREERFMALVLVVVLWFAAFAVAEVAHAVRALARALDGGDGRYED
jgi:MFS superfamily sulfate permease-like transporter